MLLPIAPQFTALKPELVVASAIIAPPSLKVQVKDSIPEKGRILNTLPINLSRITQSGKYSYESLLDLPPSIRLPDGEREKTVRIDIVVDKERLE